MTQHLSDKIRIVSFFLIIVVLYIHSGFHADEINGMYLNNFVQEFISGKIGRLAVPLFFMISGYLFFRNTQNGLNSIFIKIRKRINTLLIPYIIGCLFFVAFSLLVGFLPVVSHYMNGNILELFNQSILQILKYIFWSSESGVPMAFQLWFLRDLIFIVACSPILYYIIKYLRWWALALFFGLSLIPGIEELSIFSSVFWFVSGGILSFTNAPVVFNKTKWGCVVLTIYLFISLFEQIYGGGYFVHFQKILILMGIVGVWLCYDHLVNRKFSLKENKWLTMMCRFSFFIYVFHEPTINIVRKAIVILLGKNSVGYLLSYLLSPIIFSILAIAIGIYLKKLFPKSYSILVGGRI